MVQGTSPKLVRREMLYDVNLTGAQNASSFAIAMGKDTNVNRVINRGEWAEVKYVEVISPLIAATGASDHLDAIRPFFDGAVHRGNDKYIIRADLDNSIAFAPNQLSKELLASGQIYVRKFLALGLTLTELLQMGVESNPQLLLQNTTLKTKENGSINWTLDTDTGGTAGQIEVRGWGNRYTDADLLDSILHRVYGQGEGRRIELRDPHTNRDFGFTINPKNIDHSHFDALLGGNNQDLAGGVSVDRFFRWAQNTKATNPNQEYDMNFDVGNVSTSDQALSDPFSLKNGIPDDALVLYDRLGLNPHANHSEIRIQLNQQYISKEMSFTPSVVGGGTAVTLNHLEFGRATAIGPAVVFSDHQFNALPEIAPIFASGEQLKIMIVDNGTAIPAGTTYGAGDLLVATGWYIKSPEYKGTKPKPLGGN